MNGRDLFYRIDEMISPRLAVAGDRIGYIGQKDPSHLEISRVMVLMDYIPGIRSIDYTAYDLVILHHPPLVPPEIPAYVVHSNWDIADGGACDALADSLDIRVDDVLDSSTGLGRIGTIRNGPVPMFRFLRYAMRTLMITNLRVVNYSKKQCISRIGIVPGFGLNLRMIQAASTRNLDLYLSGDLTHQGAVWAQATGQVLVDATHYATELPGLKRLGELVSGFGLRVTVLDTGVPEGIISDYYHPVSYKGINCYQRFPAIPVH
jgi:dinuclear metal center YbgI/SA1388 family protein